MGIVADLFLTLLTVIFLLPGGSRLPGPTAPASGSHTSIMKIIHRYIIREFLVSALFGLAVSCLAFGAATRTEEPSAAQPKPHHYELSPEAGK